MRQAAQSSSNQAIKPYCTTRQPSSKSSSQPAVQPLDHTRRQAAIGTVLDMYRERKEIDVNTLAVGKFSLHLLGITHPEACGGLTKEAPG